MSPVLTLIAFIGDKLKNTQFYCKKFNGPKCHDILAFSKFINRIQKMQNFMQRDNPSFEVTDLIIKIGTIPHSS
ncbi:hypothetical protein HZS_3926 [Henneguya salminicola]|nr:hypothetical protein HZS_3926 [Henneguya salminicola]